MTWAILQTTGGQDEQDTCYFYAIEHKKQSENNQANKTKTKNSMSQTCLCMFNDNKVIIIIIKTKKSNTDNTKQAGETQMFKKGNTW